MLRIIEIIEEKLQNQQDEIELKNWQIADLKRQVQELTEELKKEREQNNEQ